MQYCKMYMCSVIQNQWGIHYCGNFQTSFRLVPLPLLIFKKPTEVFVARQTPQKHLKIPL